MKPGRYDLPTIWKGCDWLPITFKWKDGEGNPVDLTGLTPFVQTNGGINLNPGILDAANGVVLLSLPKSITENLRVGDQQWDWVWWQNYPTGVKYPPMLAGVVPIREPHTDQFS